MKIDSVRKYLRDYRICDRWTTFNGALQAALAIPETFDLQKAREAIALLGQGAEEELACVYCGAAAATWDHLYNNVVDGRFSGYGNRIYNLVPACRTCNEKKGAKHWRKFLDEQKPADHATRVDALTKFEACANLERFGWEQIQAEFPELAAQYDQMRADLRAALTRADEVAKQLRERIRARVTQPTGSK